VSGASFTNDNLHHPSGLATIMALIIMIRIKSVVVILSSVKQKKPPRFCGKAFFDIYIYHPHYSFSGIIIQTEIMFR
jgi:hypothetical protein